MTNIRLLNDFMSFSTSLWGNFRSLLLSSLRFEAISLCCQSVFSQIWDMHFQHINVFLFQTFLQPDKSSTPERTNKVGLCFQICFDSMLCWSEMSLQASKCLLTAASSLTDRSESGSGLPSNNSHCCHFKCGISLKKKNQNKTRSLTGFKNQFIKGAHSLSLSCSG